MIADARTIAPDSQLKADVCIFGAGAAGITLALQLEKQGLSVCLVESGGREYEPKVQELYGGQTSGTPYNLEGSRLRYLGGSTNHWSGQCLPLDAEDFQSKAWIQGSGWPFQADELSPYYREAASTIGIDPFPDPLTRSFEAKESARQGADRPVDQGRQSESTLLSGIQLPDFGTAQLFIHERRFGPHFERHLKESPSIQLWLYANHDAFLFDNDRVHVARALSDTGQPFQIQADHFILATGGIENARILLDQERHGQQPPGNQSGLLGQRFMEHYHSPLAILLAPPDAPFHGFQRKDSMYYKMSDREDRLGFFAPTPTLREQAQTGHFRIQVGLPGAFDSPFSTLENDLLSVLPAWQEKGATTGTRLTGAGAPLRKFLIYSVAEQSPNSKSRISLGKERDRLGRPRAHLHWDMNDLDRHTLRQSIYLFSSAIARAGYGRLRFIAEKELWVIGGMHHMGTTCMHKNPSQGVVDANLQVHGTANLYVAGSSVFPTVGHANPTFTIVALAIRLAHHIAQRKK